MFKIIGSKIFFDQWEVATLDPWLRDSVRMDLTRELEGHTKTEDVDQMLKRISNLEIALTQVDERELWGAKWAHS